MPAGLTLAAILLQSVLTPTMSPIDTLPPDSLTSSSSTKTDTITPAVRSSLLRLDIADLNPTLLLPPADTVRRRPKAVEYSSMYATRFKIHQIASFATLPLFVTQYAVGEDLYKHGSQASSFSRSAHGPLAGAIAGLFAVNTVTGVWNMLESRKDPNGRTRRTVHGLMMLVADAGFVAVGATAPEHEDGDGGGAEQNGNRGLHKGLAIGSMSLSLASYLMMYIWKH